MGGAVGVGTASDDDVLFGVDLAVAVAGVD